MTSLLSSRFGRRHLFRFSLWSFGALFCVFLLGPVLVVIPLSFNSESFFTYPMPGLSLRWYQEFAHSSSWRLAARNSVVIASATVILSLGLGILAALGLVRMRPLLRLGLTALFVAPMLVPVVISGVGLYFFFASLGILNTIPALVFAHTMLAVPFVVISVRAALSGFDSSLIRAALSLGANPFTAFRRIMLPLILPGILSGAVFAFVCSFDEAVVTLFLAGSEQRTLPRQMWAGVREQISPTILAVATVLIGFSLIVMVAMELVRRRTQRSLSARLGTT